MAKTPFQYPSMKTDLPGTWTPSTSSQCLAWLQGDVHACTAWRRMDFPQGNWHKFESLLFSLYHFRTWLFLGYSLKLLLLTVTTYTTKKEAELTQQTKLVSTTGAGNPSMHVYVFNMFQATIIIFQMVWVASVQRGEWTVVVNFLQIFIILESR